MIIFYFETSNINLFIFFFSKTRRKIAVNKKVVERFDQYPTKIKKLSEEEMKYR